MSTSLPHALRRFLASHPLLNNLPLPPTHHRLPRLRSSPHHTSSRPFRSTRPSKSNDPLHQTDTATPSPKGINYSKYTQAPSQKPTASVPPPFTTTPANASTAAAAASTVSASTAPIKPSFSSLPLKTKLAVVVKRTLKATLYTSLFLWLSGVTSYYLYKWYSPYQGFFSLVFLDILRAFRMWRANTHDINDFTTNATADNDYELQYYPESLTESVKSAQRLVLKENFILQRSVQYVLSQTAAMTKWVDRYGESLNTLFQYVCVQEINAQRQVLNEMLMLYQHQLRSTDQRWEEINHKLMMSPQSQNAAGGGQRGKNDQNVHSVLLSPLNPSFGSSYSDSLISLYNTSSSSSSSSSTTSFDPQNMRLSGEVLLVNPQPLSDPFPGRSPPSSSAPTPSSASSVHLPTDIEGASNEKIPISLPSSTTSTSPLGERNAQLHTLDPNYLTDQTNRYLSPFLIALTTDRPPVDILIQDIPAVLGARSPSDLVLQINTTLQQRRLDQLLLDTLTSSSKAPSSSTPSPGDDAALEPRVLDQNEINEIRRLQYHLTLLTPAHRQLFDEKVRALGMIHALQDRFDATFKDRLDLQAMVSQLVQFDPNSPNIILPPSGNLALPKGASVPGEDAGDGDETWNSTQTQDEQTDATSPQPPAASKMAYNPATSPLPQVELNPDELVSMFQLPNESEHTLKNWLIDFYPVQFARDHDIEVSAYLQYQRDEGAQISNMQAMLRKEMIASGQLPSSGGADGIEGADTEEHRRHMIAEMSRTRKINELLGSGPEQGSTSAARKFDSSFVHDESTEYYETDFHPNDGDADEDNQTDTQNNLNNNAGTAPATSVFTAPSKPKATLSPGGYVEDYGTYTYQPPSGSVSINDVLLGPNSIYASPLKNAPFTFQFFSQHALTLYQLGYVLSAFRTQLEDFSTTSLMLLQKVQQTEVTTNVAIGDKLDMELEQHPTERRQLEAFFVDLNQTALDYLCARLNMHQLLAVLQEDTANQLQFFHNSYPLPRIMAELNQFHEGSVCSNTIAV